MCGVSWRIDVRTGPACLLALPAALVVAAAAPAHTGFHVVEVGGYAFTPATTTVETDEEVLWTWPGVDRDHSVTAEPGQAEAFDSDPGGVTGPAPRSRGFSHVFRTPGTYRYVCKVHAGMRGTVVVTPRATPADATAPVLSGLRVPRRARDAVDVRFRLDEAADVEVVLERLRPGRAPRRVRTRTARRDAGAHRLRLPARTLPRGAYRVSAFAVDLAGNGGRTARRPVRLVR